MTRRKVRARILATGLISAFGLLGVSSIEVQSGCADKAAPAAAPAPIVIGVSLDLTGKPRRIRGAAPQVDRGLAERPQLEWRRARSARRLRRARRPERQDKGIVERIANGFVQKHVAAVIGPVGSQQIVATQKIYADAHIVQISPSATSTDLATIQPATDRWLFRTTPADDFQAAAVMLFAQRTPRGLSDAGFPQTGGGLPVSCSKLALVNVDNSSGNSMADVIESNWPKRVGQPIVTRQRVSVTLTASYADVVRAVLAANPQCLALIAYDDVAAELARELKADAKYAQLVTQSGFFFIGTDDVYTDGFLARGRTNQSDPTSANVAEGFIGTNPDTQPGTPEYRQFLTLYSASFPLKPTEDAPAFAANTFDAAILLALAIQAAGSAEDHVALRDVLHAIASAGKPYTPGQLGLARQAVRENQDIDYKGASGNMDLEPNGNVKSGFIVWEASRRPATDPDPAKRNATDYRTIGRFTLDELLGQLQ